MKTLLAFFLIFTVSKASAWNDIPKGAFLNKVYNCSSSQTQFPVTSVNQGPLLSIFHYLKPMGSYLPAFEHLYFLSESQGSSGLDARTFKLVPQFLNSSESLYQSVDNSGRQVGYFARYFERSDTFEVHPASRNFVYYCQ